MWRRAETEWHVHTKTHFVSELANVESFITHNGDLDFFTINGNTLHLGDIQGLLEQLLGQAMPSDVDSAAVAGLLDLLRCKGLWMASVRYGYVFGALATAGSLGGERIGQLAEPVDLQALADLCAHEWETLMREMEQTDSILRLERLLSNVRSESELLSFYHEAIRKRLLKRWESGFTLFRGEGDREALRAFETPPLPGVQDRKGAMLRLVETACMAFLYGDLLRAALELLGGADGSFGLVLSHSLDADRDVVFASRGQTMSVSFYPSLGCIAFGSEAAATKACMGMSHGHRLGAPTDFEGQSFRFDLDDVAGEVVLLRWEPQPVGEHVLGSGRGAGSGPGTRHHISCGGTEREAVEVLALEAEATTAGLQPGARRLLAVNILQHGDQVNLWQRRLQLDGNPLLTAPPDMVGTDPVGRELLDTPKILEKITRDFDEPNGHSFNRITAWTFTNKLRQRLKQHHAGTHDGSVDLLITGNEVSLWTGEHFASDLQLVYPKLKIEVISSNKLLGQLGQMMPIPQPGFRFNACTHNFNQTIVLMLSHSGGTYSPLACCSLLSGYTSNIFVVTSELDTQAARAVRSNTATVSKDTNRHSFIDLSSPYIFSTHVGFRPAEACSLSIVAMHHLLTMLLIFLMGFLAHFEHGNGTAEPKSMCGSAFKFNEVRELAMMSRQQHTAAADIIGGQALGDTATSAALQKQGHRWAQHVLEGPLSWLLSLAYIGITVVLRTTPVGAIVTLIIGQPLPVPQLVPTFESPSAAGWLWALSYVVAVIDVGLYAFLGWWSTVLIRLVQGRPWLHRVAGRSVLIGDVPWVSQCAEAFASKLFALSYSISGCSFASANPADHLVHRHTHRVVRGSLLVVGRPDGRLNALTTAEAACTLSVNQASSIQNFGVTCESITLGHSSYKLPLSSGHLQLKTLRQQFACEVLRQHMNDDDSKRSNGSSKDSESPHRPIQGVTAAGLRGSLVHKGSHDDRRPSVTEGRRASFDDRRPSVTKLSRAARTSKDSSPGRRSRIDRSSKEAFVARTALLDQLAGASDHTSTAVTSIFEGFAGLADDDPKDVQAGKKAMHEASHGCTPKKIPKLAGRSRSVWVEPALVPETSMESIPTVEETPAAPRVVDIEAGELMAQSPPPSPPDANDTLSDVAPPAMPSGRRFSLGSSTRVMPSAGQQSAATSEQSGRRMSLIPIGRRMSLPNSEPPKRSGRRMSLGKAVGLAPASDTTNEEVKPRAGRRMSLGKAIGLPAADGNGDAASSKPRAGRRMSLGKAIGLSSADNKGDGPAIIDESPNAIKAKQSTAKRLSRRIFEREANAFNSESLQAFRNIIFELEPIKEPFFGAWMIQSDQHQGLTTDALMQQQILLQTLTETRFDAMQRLLAFLVMFYSMGKSVADFWKDSTFGIFQYDMSRTQSIMRVATTASPVSGMEVRDRMLAVRAETRRIRAASRIQRTFRAIRLQHIIRRRVRHRRISNERP